MPGPRILIVEDEPHVREVMEEFLRGNGHQVEVKASGREALDHLGTGPQAYDVAIVDWHMPGITGRDVIESIRELSPSTAIVITTGRATQLIRKALSDPGTVGVLEKPFSLRDLASWVEKALERRPEFR